MGITIATIMPDQVPDFTGILAHLCLFRCGGQQRFTADEVAAIMHDYIGIRVVFDKNTGDLIVTLKTTDSLDLSQLKDLL